jgi:hypothetical protein
MERKKFKKKKIKKKKQTGKTSAPQKNKRPTPLEG